MKKNILALTCSIVFSLFILEIGIRLFMGNQLYLKDHRDDMFWTEDENLGWGKRPNSSGVFSNGFYKGFITNDEDGNRKNSDSGTFVDGYKNIFFIGDSTTASLEVNNNETVPALLEQKLRQSGKKVNVINLGVRGYGTDQSVRKAIQFAEKHSPEQIIYMFCINDTIDNNIIKQPYKKYGKGVYIKKNAADQNFETHNYPVPQYKNNYGGMVFIDESGNSYIHEVTLPEKNQAIRKHRDAFKLFLKKHLYILRAYGKVQDYFKFHGENGGNEKGIQDRDPRQLVDSGIKWSDQFYASYQDGGAVRMKHQDYFYAQMKYILTRLKQIKTLKKITLIWFPTPSETDLVKKDKSANQNMFIKLLNEGVVDEFLDLNTIVNQEDISFKRLQCKGDSHFCQEGNRWICDQVLQRCTL